MAAFAARLLTATACLAVAWNTAAAQPAAPATGPALRGAVVLAEDGRPVPGVVVLVVSTDGATVAEAVTDGEGRYTVATLAPGAYDMRVALEGFAPQTLRVIIAAGTTVEQDLRVQVQAIRDEVTVAADVSADTVSAVAREVSASVLDRAPLPNDSVLSLLPLLPGVIRAPDGRLRMSGGQPSQSGLQVSSASVTDPSTGDLAFEPPGDAVEAVQFLPNPYGAEHGRFSTGLAEIRTRQGGDTWAFTLNSFLPRFRTAPDKPLKLLGIGSFAPRLGISGPIRAGRWYLAQSLQYRRVRTEVKIPSRPTTTLNSVDSYTRLDSVGSQGQRLTLALALFPRDLDGLLLNAFTPIASTARFEQRGFNAGASYSVASANRAATLLVNAKVYDVDLQGRGTDASLLTPTGPLGRYFNDQGRQTDSLQVVQTVTQAFAGPRGEHLVKAGVDVLATRYTGTSASLPVEVRRVDGSLAERVTFGAPSRQEASGVDVGLFAQHEWRPSGWITTELGARLDRDGTIGHVNASPRGSIAFAPGRGDTTVLRVGAGRFYQRTPLNVAAFGDFEARTVSRWDRDGELVDTSVLEHVTGRLETPSSVTWNAEVTHRLNDTWLLRLNHLNRRGYDEYIVSPGDGRLTLSSDGQSRYRETELTVRYTSRPVGEIIVTYVRSRAEADLNAYDTYFGNLRAPFIRPNEYAPISTDTPNRVLIRGTINAGRGIEVLPVVEIRDGFPYTTVDEEQQFVGGRHTGRFPRLVTLDLAVQRTIRVGRWRPRVGLRFFNLLNRGNPRDVLANVDVAGAPIFDNPTPRWVGITLWFDR